MKISTLHHLLVVFLIMYMLTFVLFPSPVNELQVLSDDCRYLVLLAKIQNKVDKKEEALLSLERVSESFPQWVLLGVNERKLEYNHTPWH